MSVIKQSQFARSLNGRRVVVVGLARTGVAAARLLVGLGARVSVSDVKPASELKEAVATLPAGVEFAFGGHPLDLFRRAHLVVTSPGVPWDAPPLAEARQAGVEVISEIELVWRLLPTRWVAVTGSNGKSTTTTLIGQMADAAGLRVVVGGNIGNPMAGLIDEASGADYLVAEISTFQLEGVRDFQPSVAVVLNVTEDHLYLFSQSLTTEILMRGFSREIAQMYPLRIGPFSNSPCTPDNQYVEVMVKCATLNRMTGIGMPESVWIR